MIGRPGQEGLPGYMESADYEDFRKRAPKHIYDALQEASSIYHESLGDWKQYMQNAYQDSNKKVSAEAMAKRYVESAFSLALQRAEERTSIAKKRSPVVPQSWRNSHNVSFLENSI